MKFQEFRWHLLILTGKDKWSIHWIYWNQIHKTKYKNPIFFLITCDFVLHFKKKTFGFWCLVYVFGFSRCNGLIKKCQIKACFIKTDTLYVVSIIKCVRFYETDFKSTCTLTPKFNFLHSDFFQKSR